MKKTLFIFTLLCTFQNTQLKAQTDCQNNQASIFNYLDFWNVEEDPTTVEPIESLLIDGVGLEINRTDEDSILVMSEVSFLNTLDGVYKINQEVNGANDHSTLHEFVFTESINNLLFEVIDVDKGLNYEDQIIIRGYNGSVEYEIQPEDIIALGVVVSFDGNNTFHGLEQTDVYPEGNAKILFPDLIDRVVVEFKNIYVFGFNTQAIAFNFGMNWCNVQINSINEGQKNNEEFLIYPNPNAGNYINIEIDSDIFISDYMLSIVDITGRMVYQKNQENSGSIVKSIDLDQRLSSGTYFVKVENETHTMIEKLVVK